MIKIREGEGGKVNKEVKERVISILSAEIHNRNCKPRRFFCRAPPADRMVKIMDRVRLSADRVGIGRVEVLSIGGGIEGSSPRG